MHRIENELLDDCWHAIAYYPTGSRYICSPAPTDTDEDYVVLLRPGSKRYIETWMQAEGFELHGRQYNSAEFWSFKKNENGTVVNYITSDNPEFYENFILATEEAKSRNLLNKEDRIKLFEEYRV
jgi:hypothetical protein